MTRALPRRMVLRGMFNGGVISVGVPALEAMLNTNGTRYAHGQPFTKRYGGIFLGHGCAYMDYSMKGGSSFIPTTEGSGNGWSLPSGLASLAPVKDHLCYINGMTSGVTAHSQGIVTGYPSVCAGEEGLLGTGKPGAYSPKVFPFYAAEPSIDQIIANTVGQGDPIRSLEVGVCHYTSATAPGIMAQAMSFPKRNVANLPAYDPRQVFNRVFGNFLPTDASPAEKARAGMRQSVIDVVREDTKSLQRVCGPEDCRRLDQHYESLRSLEKTLAAPPVCSAVPDKPSNTYDRAGNNEAQLKYVNSTMGKLVAMALACNRTRVFTNLFSKEGDGTVYNWLGATDGDHAVTHDPKQRGQQFANVKWRMERLSDFLQELKAVPGYAGKTLLDSCAVLYTSGTQGAFHLPLNIPVIIAGSLNGDMKTNFYHWSKIYDFGEGKTNINRVFLTIMRLMGVNLDAFGPPPDYSADGRKVFYGYGKVYGGADDYVVPVKDWQLRVTESLPALVA